MPVVINGTTGINTPGQTTAGEQIVQRADTNDLLRLSRTGSSAGEGYLYSNANEIFGVKDTGTTYPFLVKRGAPSNSFTLDSSGRLTIPNQPNFQAYLSTTWTFSNGSVVPFNLTSWNVGSNFNTSTNRFTAPISGTYAFYTRTYTSVTSGNVRAMHFKFLVNGSIRLDATTGGFSSDGGFSYHPAVNNFVTIQLSAGDYVQFYLSAGDYGSANFGSGATETIFGGYLVC